MQFVYLEQDVHVNACERGDWKVNVDNDVVTLRGYGGENVVTVVPGYMQNGVQELMVTEVSVDMPITWVRVAVNKFQDDALRVLLERVLNVMCGDPLDDDHINLPVFGVVVKARLKAARRMNHTLANGVDADTFAC